MSGTRLRSNPIGESIYNKIQDCDNMAHKEFLATLPAEHTDLYNKYRIARNVANHIEVKMTILKRQIRRFKRRNEEIESNQKQRRNSRTA